MKKGKLITMAVSFLLTVGIVGAGFAAWVISADVVKEATGTVTVEEVIDKRMEIALLEIARATEYDYIVVNDDLSTAVDDLISIITNSRLLLNRQKHIISEVLKNAKS